MGTVSTWMQDLPVREDGIRGFEGISYGFCCMSLGFVEFVSGLSFV